MTPIAKRVELAQLAIRTGREFAAECRRLKAAGELDRAVLAYAIEGAAEYVRAIATGDIASETDRVARLAKCAVCPNRTTDPDRPNKFSGYCGPKLQDHRKATPPTCGCPLDVLTMVASCACVQENWTRVPRAT